MLSHPLRNTLLCAALSTLWACGNAAPTTSAASNVQTPAAKKAEPTLERLRERCGERWAAIERKDLVLAYDMLDAEPKRALSLAQFLAQRQSHLYEDPKIVEMVGLDGMIGFVKVSVLWTPKHPELANIKDPEQIEQIKKRFPERIEQIETWRFADGDWGWIQAERVEDFFRQHPELLRQPAAEKAIEAPPAATQKPN
jgi:hypothetical protein